MNRLRLGFLCIVLLVGVVFITLTARQVGPVFPQTYTSRDGGFSFHYPADWGGDVC